MKPTYFVISLLIVLGNLTSALSQTPSQTNILYEIRNLEIGDEIMPYRIMLPENFDPINEYPLIVFLHGSGERGSDNSLQLKHGGSFFASDSIRSKYPAIVVFPQCPVNRSWNNSRMRSIDGKRQLVFPETIEDNPDQDLLSALLRTVASEYLLDPQRIYIGGLSMGGMGTFEAVRRNPGIFAAAFPICGGANPVISEEISATSWWVFHGEDDMVVPVSCSEQMVEGLEEFNADVRFSKYPKVRHDSWTNAFSEPDLMQWLFSKTLD